MYVYDSKSVSQSVNKSLPEASESSYARVCVCMGGLSKIADAMLEGGPLIRF